MANKETNSNFGQFKFYFDYNIFRNGERLQFYLTSKFVPVYILTTYIYNPLHPLIGTQSVVFLVFW